MPSLTLHPILGVRVTSAKPAPAPDAVPRVSIAKYHVQLHPLEAEGPRNQRGYNNPVGPQPGAAADGDCNLEPLQSPSPNLPLVS